MSLRLFTIAALRRRVPFKPIGSVGAHDTIRSVIGNRDIVGFGVNGKPEYVDRHDYPFPSLRWMETTPDIVVCSGSVDVDAFIIVFVLNLIFYSEEAESGLPLIKSPRLLPRSRFGLLDFISCNCKQGCGATCDCRKAGLKYSMVCGFCSGQSCENAPEVRIERDEDEEILSMEDQILKSIESNELEALREKEKGDWRKLTFEEKKCLYRLNFRQTFAEFTQQSVGDWKSWVGWGLFWTAAGLWLFLLELIFVYSRQETPMSYSEEWKRAQLRRILDIRAQGVNGLSSKWDYEKDNWKK